MRPELVQTDFKRWDPGEIIGRYTLLARIAVGGMAEIWLARQQGVEGFEKVVVIKRIADAYSADATFVEMFLDEARIASQLDHPNIVQIHDLGEHRGAYFIAMEYLHGEDLAMVVRTGAKTRERLPFTLAARIISAAAEGLASAHQKVGLDGRPLDVVHRDVSPQNVFVTYDGLVKVLDFGVAKAANRASHTQGGQLKGKFGYMSPEQARGDDIDARADVWSLGVVLFEAVTVSRLWDPKQEPQRTLRDLVSDAPAPLARSRHPDVPVELEQIIATALARDTLHRYQSATELKHALDKWLNASGEESGTAELSGYMRKLFAERLGRKSALIDSARSGEIKFFKVPEALKPVTETSMPGETLVSGLRHATRAKPKLALMALLGVAAAFIVLAGVWLSLAVYEPPLLEVDTSPSGARLEVDGVEIGHAPIRVASVGPGKHVVMAFLEGRQDKAKTVTLAAGEVTRVFLTFAEPPQPAPPPPPAAALPSPPPADDAPKPAADAAPFDPEPPVVAVKAAAPVERAAPAVPRGKLSVETNPWTHVFANGKKLGETPLIGYSLPAGKHKLKLINDEKHISKNVEVTVLPGKTTVTRLELE